MPYYWSARQKEHVEPGFRIPGWDPSRGGPEVVRLEAIWEEVRQSEFPDRPSRLGAVFVCPSLRCMFCDPKSWRNDPSYGGGVYEVSVSGNRFVANSECFTEARQDASRGEWKRVREWGHQYWRGGAGGMESLKEVIVQGTVTVKRKLQSGDKRGSGSRPIRVERVMSRTPDPKRVAATFLREASSRGMSKTAGEVRFIKDRGGDKSEWAWGTPGPANREIGEEYQFKVKSLKPLSITLRATLMAMGHAISAQNTFAKIKSSDVSPDGNLGGKGYIQKVADMRRQYANVVEALSALSDTLYDEIIAPHWKPDATNGGPREREEVEDILGDAEEVRADPEGWATEQEEEGVEGAEPSDILEPSEGSKSKKPRGKTAMSVALRHLQAMHSTKRVTQ